MVKQMNLNSKICKTVSYYKFAMVLLFTWWDDPGLLFEPQAKIFFATAKHFSKLSTEYLKWSV